jgi:hypothetical protein
VRHDISTDLKRGRNTLRCRIADKDGGNCFAWHYRIVAGEASHERQQSCCDPGCARGRRHRRRPGGDQLPALKVIGAGRAEGASVGEVGTEDGHRSASGTDGGPGRAGRRRAFWLKATMATPRRPLRSIGRLARRVRDARRSVVMLGFAEGRQPAPRSSPVDAPNGGEEIRNH